MSLPAINLTIADRERLSRLVADAQHHWTRHHLQFMVSHLARESAAFRTAAILEFTLIDLEHRWGLQERVYLEGYLEKFPELVAVPAAVRELIRGEIRVRDRAGDRLDPAEYARRFPTLAGQLGDLPVPPASSESDRTGTKRDAESPPSKPVEAPAQATTDSSESSASARVSPARASPARVSSGEVGECFDHYRLLRVLGNGSMGTVYLAEDTRLGRLVALKRPRNIESERSALLRRFYREAHAAAKLNHPGICPVFEIGECQGIPFIAMAYLEGRTLSETIREGRTFSPRAAASLIRKLALALAEAHGRGIIHRDLQPGNIMLNQRGEPVLMDFGLARHEVGVTDDQDTREGDLLGTVWYLSPEQAEGDAANVGAASDIYSLGVLFFELLTGQVPFQGPTLAVLRRIVKEMPSAPSALREGVPPELDAICLRMLAKDPAARFYSMLGVAEALTEYLRSKGDSASLAGPPPVSETLVADLQAERRQIEHLVADGQWSEASERLDRMSASRSPAAAPFVLWAREELAALHALWQRRQQAAAQTLVDARADFARHDYAGAAERLGRLERPFRVGEAALLLDEAAKLAEEVDLLAHLIEQGLRGVRPVGMVRNLQRLLQLKPRDPVVRDLYRKYRWRQRLGRFGAALADAFSMTGASRVETTLEDPLYRKWFAWSALVFLIAFGLMNWHVRDYLRNSRRQPASGKEDIANDLPFSPEGATSPTFAGPTAAAIAPFDAQAAARFQAAWAERVGVPVEVENSFGMKLRLIPVGEFAMGLADRDLETLLVEARREKTAWTERHLRAAAPQHRIRINQPFYIGATEVTQTQWNAVMRTSHTASSPSTGNLPVVNKSWADIEEFLKRLNRDTADPAGAYFLPSEAQWEFACVAGQSSDEYADLAKISQQVWHSGNSGGTVRPVAQRSANEWGLFDLGGNVWEWCADWFDEGYYRNSPTDEPRGPATGTQRSLRGGAWSHPPVEAGGKFRIGGNVDHRDNDVGFRLAARFSLGFDKSLAKRPSPDQDKQAAVPSGT